MAMKFNVDFDSMTVELEDGYVAIITAMYDRYSALTTMADIAQYIAFEYADQARIVYLQRDDMDETLLANSSNRNSPRAIRVDLAEMYVLLETGYRAPIVELYDEFATATTNRKEACYATAQNHDKFLAVCLYSEPTGSGKTVVN